MRLVCTIALLLAASCARDNPLYATGQATGDAAAVDATTSSTTRGASDSDSDDGVAEGVTHDTGGASDSDGGATGGSTVSPRCDGEPILEASFGELPTSSEDWYVSAPDTLEVAAIGGALHVGFDHDSGYWVMGSMDPIPRRASLGFELHETPDSAHPIQALVSLNDGALVLQFSMAQGFIDISWWDQQQGQATSATDTGPIPFDPVAHRWMRLSFDTELEQATAAVSSDGVAWTDAFSANISALALDQTVAQFSVGAWASVPGTDVVVVDNAFMCVP